MQQPVFERQRLAERRALRAQPPEIGRMLGIAGDAGAAAARPGSPTCRNRPRNMGRSCLTTRSGVGCIARVNGVILGGFIP